MKRGKQGQFYLIAAIMIVSVMIGFLSIINYARKTSSIDLEDVRDELLIESQKVSEYDMTQNQIKLEDDFPKLYSDYLGDKIDIYFLTGNSTNMTGYHYAGGSKEWVSTNLESGSASINVNGTDYEFDLGEGKSFYFVITQDIGGERYVVTG